MRGLPLYNGALTVEAVSFAVREPWLSGVLLTPWSMNLVLLPDSGQDPLDALPGVRVRIVLPAGDYEFMLSALEGFAPHLSLPLFTTVTAFTDQATARAVAQEVVQALYHPAQVRETSDPVDAELRRLRHREGMSRRALLLGRATAGKGRTGV